MLRAGSGPAQGRAEDENMASVSAVTTRSKQPAHQPEKAGAAKRRALGDIGNIGVGPSVLTRAKDKAASGKAAAASGGAAPATAATAPRASRGLDAPSTRQPPRGSGGDDVPMLSAGALHAPRTRSQARAAAAQQQQQPAGGVVAASSLSSLLASRAAAAAAGAAPTAPAPPPAPAPPTDDISSRQQNQQRQRSAGRAATASSAAQAEAAAAGGAAAGGAIATAATLAPAAAAAQPPALAPLPPAGPPPSSSADAARRPHPFLPADPPRGPLPDIDAPDRHNPMAAADYADALYSHYRRAERQFRVDPSYMRLVQRDVNEKMRAILVDWLVEVHLKFKLMPETLFLTTSLIDRFLACTPVSRKRLQLVGVTAMLVASKYEEIWAPEVRDFVYISDKAYDRAQILGMEREMLSALGYRLTLPTSYQFLARLLKAASAHYDKKLALFVAYCAELCLVEYSTLRYSPSELAAGVMYVAMRAMGRDDPFPPRLAAHAAVPGKVVLAAAKDVVRIVARAPSASLTAVHRKYSSPKFMEAAKVPAPMDILEE